MRCVLRKVARRRARRAVDRDGPISKLREQIAASGPELLAAWLFGSYARGTARRDSDVDLALLYREHPGPMLDNPAAGLELAPL